MEKLLTMMVAAFFGCPLFATTWYVNGTSGLDGYSGKNSDWAKKTIQAAIDAAVDGDVILVAPGTYAPIITYNKAVHVKAVGNAKETIIDAQFNGRCVSGFGTTDSANGLAPDQNGCAPNFDAPNATTNTSIIGFCIQNGKVLNQIVNGQEVHGHGGCVSGGTYIMCVIKNGEVGEGGGGCHGAVAQNCLIVGNRAKNGGAAQACALYNCTIVNNTCDDNGAALWDDSVAVNCVVYGNSPESCTIFGSPMMINVCLEDPIFVDAANGDYRLAANSPCIDAGDNSYVTSEVDLDGNARIVNGKVDIGCYEYGTEISLNNGLVAWYKFDGDWMDRSGNGNHLIPKDNTPTLAADRYGNANSACAFDGGKKQNLWLGDQASDDCVLSNSFTYSMWVKATKSYTDYGAGWAVWNEGCYAIFPVHGDMVLPNGAGLGLKVGYDGIELVEHDTFYMPTVLSYQSAIGYGWNHVAVTIENDGAPLLYVNGVKVAEGTVTDKIKVAQPTLLGGDEYGYFTGAMDDVRFYDRALSAAEVKALYDDDGLVAHYKFDGNANDSSGNGNNGVVQGATLTADRFGNPNGAYAFDGVDDSIRVPSSVSLETAITKFCVSVWMKADWDYYDVIPILHKDQQLACVLQKAHSGMSGQPEESDFFVGAGWFEDDFEFGCKVPVDGFWHHWAFVGDGINIKVYLDGSYKGSGSVGLVDKSDSDLYVGVVNLEGYLSGTLDDLRIYNRALSAAEVKALYEGEGGSSAGGVQLWENGPYWAECNVGASGAEGEGWSFLFGDTRAHRRVGDTGDEWEETGSVVSAGATDPAEAYWGEGWRCPTGDEYRRLFTDCDYHWEVVRGVTGWRLQGRGSFRDNSIFIPLPPEDPMEDDWLRDYRTDGGDVAQILCEGAKCWSDDSRRIGPCLVHWWGFEGNPALLRAVRDTPLNPPSPVPTMYMVTLDAAGGAAEWTQGEVAEGAAVGTLPTATREGYEFLGWFTAAVGGTQVTAATVVTEDVTFYAQWRQDDGTPSPQYGPWGEAEAVKNPDKLGPTMLTDMTLELNGAAGAVGDVVAAFRGDTGALCGLGKVMDASGTLSMVCYAPTGVKLHFKVWVAASGVENPVVVDCDAKSDLTAPASGAFLSGHALVVSDDKDLTISLGSADWHTVSFNVLPEDPSPAAVFGSVKSKIAAVTQGIEFWMPGKSSSLKAIEIGKGYWVNTKVDDVEWTVSGKTDSKTEIALEEGWNLVGYAPETEGAVQQVLKTALAAKAVDYVTYGVEFYPGGTLKKMEPGKAYWVHATKAWRLVYDDGAALKAARILAGAAAGDGGSTRLGAATPTYGPWGESEAVKNPDKLGPTFLTDMAVEIDGEPAEYGDVVAAFRGDTGALCGLGKVMDDSGTLTVVCYAPKGVTLSFKVWLSESGVEEAVVVKCDNASKLVAPDVGAFYNGHAISGSTAELIETIVPGEKVTIDTGLDVGYTASGLPSGLKYDKNTGKITGSASKPTAAEGAVVKFTKKGFETEELTIVVTAIPKVTVTMEGVNSPSDTDGCKVTGAGAYLVGKKVTLKATAPKGVVFMGWAAAGDGGSTGGATYSFTMGKEDVNLVAKFKKEVMSVGCEALSSKESLPAGVLCAEDGIALDITTESGVKSVKVDKLPAGMKYDAKTGLITGAPTKAGDSKVVITVTAKSGAVAKKEIEVKVAAMPETVAGTFNGFVMVGEDNLGTFTLTTTDAGKLTAKVITAAGTVSFSGSGFAWSRDGKYGVKLETKKGEKLTLTLDSAAAWDAQQLVGNYSSANGRALDVTAQRNAFGKTWYFAADGNEATGWTFAYAATAKAAALTVTVKADGSTAIAGSLPNGTDAKGKALTIKVSASGYANVGLMREGAMAADFAPVLTVSKVKKVLAIRTNLWFDRKNDHGSGVGEAKFVE